MIHKIRVHGVGRHEPARLLGVARNELEPLEADSAETSGFYRLIDDTSEEGFVWSPLTYDARLQRFWLLLLPFILLNATGFTHTSPNATLSARVHQFVIKVVNVVLIGMLILWLTLVVVRDLFLTAAIPVQLPASPFLRLLIGWIAVITVVAGLWLLARYQAALHGSLDGMGDPPSGRPSWSEWWNENPGSVTSQFWQRSTGQRRETTDTRNFMIIWLGLALAWTMNEVWTSGCEGAECSQLDLDLAGPIGLLVRMLIWLLTALFLLGTVDWLRNQVPLGYAFTPFVLATTSVILALIGAVAAWWLLGLRVTPKFSLVRDMGPGLLSILEPSAYFLLLTVSISAGAVLLTFIKTAFTAGPDRKIARLTALAKMPARIPQLLLPGTAAFVLASFLMVDEFSTVAFELTIFDTIFSTFVGVAGVLAVVLVTVWRTLRERLGVTWDVLTFWPRFFTQLAPAPYAARAVPQLSARIESLTGARKQVILLGHSQGSVIAYCATARMSTVGKAATSLATFGSPLGTLYARIFPAYFNMAGFSILQDELHDRGNGAWRNFYRRTDYIGRELSGSSRFDQEIAVDPASPRTHSSYLSEADLQYWIAGE